LATSIGLVYNVNNITKELSAMSAIWGIIEYGDEDLPRLLSTTMKEAYEHCKIDAYFTYESPKVIMGAGIQFITEESKTEVLPIINQEKDIYFTADCILDNRHALILELGFTNRSVYSDSALIYEAYQRWGKDCVLHLRGSFAFVVYHSKTKELLIFADHTFDRCIYYAIDKRRIYFSTLLNPILAVSPNSTLLNETYLSDSLSTYGLRGSIDHRYTFYQGIYKLTAGCYQRILPNSDESIRYWSPDKCDMQPPYENYQQSGHYVKHLLELSVADCMRSSSPVAGTLSSGLDSSTICGIAASQLRKRPTFDAQCLRTYTFTPQSDYQYQGESYYIANETKGVKKVVEMHPNIVATFLANEGTDPYTDLDLFLTILETPYKSIANLRSVNSLFAQASADGCKVVLVGQYGNLILSQGTFQDALYDQLKRLKFFRAYKTVTEFSQRHGFSRKKVAYHNLTRFLMQPFKSLQHRFKTDLLDATYVNPTFSKKMGTPRKLKEKGYNAENRFASHLRTYREGMYDLNLMSQIGELNTKFGLYNGVVLRDPLKDIRLLSYCYHLPLDCFYHDGLDRWLIRGNMAAYVPKALLYNTKQRGLQSADYVNRMNRRWEQIYPFFKADCLHVVIAPYVNTKKLEDFFNQYKAGIDETPSYLADPVLYVAFISRFYQKHQAKFLQNR
jgi:asparagine synthase (glutamine-hydrolysing)